MAPIYFILQITKECAVKSNINIHNLTELKKLIVRSFCGNEYFFYHQGGLELFADMDKHLVGVS